MVKCLFGLGAVVTARLLESLRGRIKRGIDLIGAKVTRDISIRDTIVISGTPRGGTTWLMDLIDTLPGYKTVFEPFHREWFPQVKQLNLAPRPYLEPHAENKPLKEYLEGIFAGRIISREPKFPLTLSGICKRLSAGKILVKFIRANRLLPWIASNFHVRGIYFIIRHPCATIASQLETGIRGYFLPKNVFPPKREILREASQIPQIGENEWLMRKLHTITAPEEILAAVWSLDNYVPLSYLSKHPDAWYSVVYERLITNFDNEIEGIFGYIGEDVPEKVYEGFRRPSITTHDKSYLGTTKQLLKWKKKLSERQIENILRVTSWFGLDFYTEDPEPNYVALKNWKPQF